MTNQIKIFDSKTWNCLMFFFSSWFSVSEFLLLSYELILILVFLQFSLLSHKWCVRQTDSSGIRRRVNRQGNPILCNND